MDINIIAQYLGYFFMVIGGAYILFLLLAKIFSFTVERYLGLFSLKAWTLFTLGWKAYQAMPPEEQAKYKYIKGK